MAEITVIFTDDAEWFAALDAAEPITLGGPGSGRYPKGSGRDHEGRASEVTAMVDAIYQKANISHAYQYQSKLSKEAEIANANLISRGVVKQHIVDDISKRFDDSMGQRKFVQSRLDNWADSSGDSNPTSVAMQQATAKEFNMVDAALDHLSDYTADQNLTMYRPEHDRAIAEMPQNRAYVRAEYENTQKFLKENGIEYVTVFRGTGGLEAEEGRSEVAMQPASSWTTSIEVAIDFANQQAGERPHEMYQHLLVARVPASQVLSTAVTGRGCLTESEVILLGGKTTAQVFKVPFETAYEPSTNRAHRLLVERIQKSLR